MSFITNFQIRSRLQILGVRTWTYFGGHKIEPTTMPLICSHKCVVFKFFVSIFLPFVNRHHSGFVLYLYCSSPRISYVSTKIEFLLFHMVLETKTWVLNMLFGIRTSFLLSPFSWQNKEIYVCIHTTHTHNYKYFYM